MWGLCRGVEVGVLEGSMGWTFLVVWRGYYRDSGLHEGLLTLVSEVREGVRFRRGL